MSKNVNFTVSGSKYGPFPMDMLRYDSAVAFSARDEMLIDDLNKDADAKRHLAKRVLVQLTTTQPGAPTIKRWESFGWEVVECSDPVVMADVQAAKRIAKMGINPATGHEIELLRDALEVEAATQARMGAVKLSRILQDLADDYENRAVLAAVMVKVLDQQRRAA